MLNRIDTWTLDGLESEADPRQSEQFIRDLGVSGCNAVGTPGVKTISEQLTTDKELSYERQRPYRGVAASPNYLPACRSDM